MKRRGREIFGGRVLWCGVAYANPYPPYIFLLGFCFCWVCGCRDDVVPRCTRNAKLVQRVNFNFSSLGGENLRFVFCKKRVAVKRRLRIRPLLSPIERNKTNTTRAKTQLKA